MNAKEGFPCYDHSQYLLSREAGDTRQSACSQRLMESLFVLSVLEKLFGNSYVKISPVTLPNTLCYYVLCLCQAAPHVRAAS